MGISLKNQRRRGRRSYAKYERRNRGSGPRNDPFRIAIYLVLIAGLVWVYFNQEKVVAWWTEQADVLAAEDEPDVVAEEAADDGEPEVTGPELAGLARDANVRTLVMTHLVPSVTDQVQLNLFFRQPAEGLFTGELIVPEDGTEIVLPVH